MVVYCTEIALCVLLGLISDSKNVSEKNKKIVFFILFFVFATVSAIRFDVGKDFNDTYVNTYYDIKNNYTHVRSDIGLYILIKIILFFNGNQQLIFIITSFIINYFIFKSIWRTI